MRAPLLFAALVLGVSPPALGAGLAHPHPRPKPPPARAAPVPLKLDFGLKVHPPPRDERLLPASRAGYGSDDPSEVSVGPLRATLGGDARTPHIARYQLDDVDILGGGVAGTVDGRGARIFLRWPTGDGD